MSIPTLRRTLATTKPPLKMAILDDYLSTSTPHFSHLSPSTVSIKTFNDPLPAYNHPLTSPAQQRAIVDRLKPYTVLSLMRERSPLPAALLDQLPNLKLLLLTGTQFQTLALDKARELGVTVASSLGRGRTDHPDKPRGTRDITQGSQHSTTQHAWALILALARDVAASDRSVKSGGWQTGLASNLGGKTLGIVGLGRLGAAVAKVGVLAWGMKIVCWSENLTQERADERAKKEGLDVVDGEGRRVFEVVGKDEVFKRADVLSVHYVLSKRTRGLIGKKELEAMKKTGLLVNTSRGPLIDEDALFEVLERGEIKGAAVDVFDIEPLPANSPFRSAKWGTGGRGQLLTTPHMGYVEEDMMNAWYAEQAENLERWMDGRDLINQLV